ncbi:MFS transporter [Aspergillus ruber CBS 135680]|uniref:MFS transporter n=1 Tax=Aspergillus ruber (strain CBS 135680) TaxID=1388766 RepID=A0A017S3P4_ASPRC|nr:MFS transporter [Aspergillus ruber CBS 135680]EYE90815.1 MFS transporter [Aspergillus ruber CBS 135680]
MTFNTDTSKPLGYRWRSSKTFIVGSVTVALFTESLLFGFIVPILSYMLEQRLHIDPSHTQNETTKLLAIYGFVSVVFATATAHVADKMPDRRTPLLYALAGCLVGTALVASTLSIWTVYLGRVLQSIASSGAWIVGFATVADAVGDEHFGKVLGVVLSFVTAGTISGPTVSGVLLKLVGYWPTWLVPMAVLVLDMLARMLMIEASKPTPSDEERTGLLPASRPASSDQEGSTAPSTSNFYRIMLLDSRVLTGLAGCLLYSSLMANFDTTIPLHVRETFHWDSLPTGLMFLCLQIPNVIFNPVSGWVRDKIGVRYPMTVGWALMAPLLFLLGMPGDERFAWVNGGHHGVVITVTCLLGIGALGSLLHGAGPMELTAVVREQEAQDPLIFGENGAGSRAFALAEMAFTLGIMLGPLLSGPLVELVGYFYMNVVFGILCLMLAVSSFNFLRRKQPAIVE